jgi:hypothetical protein
LLLIVFLFRSSSFCQSHSHSDDHHQVPPKHHFMPVL